MWKALEMVGESQQRMEKSSHLLSVLVWYLTYSFESVQILNVIRPLGFFGS
jgi:hypothetical protein